MSSTNRKKYSSNPLFNKILKRDNNTDICKIYASVTNNETKRCSGSFEEQIQDTGSSEYVYVIYNKTSGLL